MSLPRERGFFETPGFRFSLANSPAIVKPQHGLTVAIYYGGKLPVEEITHNITLTRAPHTLSAILDEYWTKKSDENSYSQTIWALQPLVEKLSRLQLSLVHDSEGKPLEATNVAYGEHHVNHLEESTRSESGDIFEKLGTDLLKVGKECTDRTVISSESLKKYIQTLYNTTELEDPIHPEIIYQTMELMLFRQLIQRTNTLHNPDDVHRETVTIIDEWRQNVESGGVPFVTDPAQFSYPSWFFGQWSHAVFHVAEEFCRSWTSNQELSSQTRFLNSIPAIAHLLNPLVANHWKFPITAATPDLVFPWVVLSADDGVLGLHKPPLQQSRVQTTLAQWTNTKCQIYRADELDVWLDAELFIRSNPTRIEEFIEKLFRQVTTYLRNLKQLYMRYSAGESFECAHCEALGACFRLDERNQIGTQLTAVVDQIEFSDISTSTVEAVATEYRTWLKRRLEQTYAVNEALDASRFSFPQS